jgi:hypothetical protein
LHDDPQGAQNPACNPHMILQSIVVGTIAGCPAVRNRHAGRTEE